MNYKKVIAYSATCVLFKLENDFFALVAVDDKEAENMITISKFAQERLTLDIYKDAKSIPSKVLKEAADALAGEHVYIFKELPKEFKVKL